MFEGSDFVENISEIDSLQKGRSYVVTHKGHTGSSARRRDDLEAVQDSWISVPGHLAVPGREQLPVDVVFNSSPRLSF